ncbi:MAG: AMP-binding protein [Gemmatimonadetes bacterium]|nr:AMP-binding protein [Gemmatimonadota bacterium]
MNDLNTLFRNAFDSGRTDAALQYLAADGTRTTRTFAELDRHVDQTAAVLVAHGLARGDRCVVHLANRIEFIELFLACLRLGVIFVPVNVLYRDRELSHIATDAAPSLIITSEEHRALFADDANVCTVEALMRERERVADANTAQHPQYPSASPETPAVIIYTSGTTGRAKGAVLSHGNLVANSRHLVDAWRITDADRYLAVLPLFHVHGLGNGICAWLATGCTMMLVERFDHALVVEWFEEFRPTLMFGVPTIYVRLLELPAENTNAMGKGMRLFVSGSAPLPAPIHTQFLERFGHTILERYGMSETLMNIGNPYDGERRPGSVGVPFRDVDARIVDDAGSPVAIDTVAQLEVRGPNVFSGYWRNPEATAKAFRDGWFRTGDMAERSSDGYYTLRGRASDLIISGGFNLYPREIEEVLLDAAGVHEVAVVGAPDARRGEVPIAYIVAESSVSDESLRALCVANLASFKTPRAFIRVSSLPRTALGKVQRHLLPPWEAS